MTAIPDKNQQRSALLFAVGSLSVVLLGYQISLMRILSYTQWYHFASMIISVALLGFGGAGTVLSLLRKRAVRHGRAVSFWASIICLLAIALTPISLSWFSIDPFLVLSDFSNACRLFLFIGLLVVPFFSGAVVVGLAFIFRPEEIGRVYFANLLGSALGIVGGVALLELVTPERLPPLLAVIALPGVWILAAGRTFRIAAASIVSAGACALFLHPGPGLMMSQFKPLARARLLPETRVTERASTPLGIVEIVEGPFLRYAPGLSLKYAGRIPSHPVVFHDGEWIGPLIPPDDSLIWPVYEHSTSFLPYCLVKPDGVLIVGAGTGAELLLARRNGARSVTGVEMDSELVRLFKENSQQFLSTDGSPQVTMMIVDEARSYLQRDTSQYSLIILPILEGQTANAAGTQAQFENYLFTVESFSQILRRLAPGGIFFVQTWMNAPPRASAKVLASVIEALRRAGVGHPESHLAGIRSWNTVALVASREPLSDQQVKNIRRFGGEMGFDLVWLPGLGEEETNHFHRLERPYLFEWAHAVFEGSGPEYARRYPFRIEPASDDRPYFSNFVSWTDLPRLLETYRSGEIPYLELGTFFLTGTVIQVGALSLVLIGLPLIFLVRSGASGRSLGAILAYFGGLGLGFMIVEMVIIQKSVLFLGDPIYSVAVVVGSLLLFSSLGSMWSPSMRILVRDRAWLLPLAVLGLLMVYTLALSPVLSLLLGMPAWARFFVLPLMIAPLGFVLGIPFPLGLSAVAYRAPESVPLAWGINGYCSVLAAGTAVLASMELGFRILQLIAVAAYAVAFAAIAMEKRIRLSSPG